MLFDAYLFPAGECYLLEASCQAKTSVMANRFARGWDSMQLKFLVCAGKILLCSRSELIEFHGCRIKPIYCVTRMLFEEVISYN